MVRGWMARAIARRRVLPSPPGGNCFLKLLRTGPITKSLLLIWELRAVSADWSNHAQFSELTKKGRRIVRRRLVVGEVAMRFLGQPHKQLGWGFLLTFDFPFKWE